MKSVKIADLKARLSAHIQYVRNGEELIVCDRDEPVAKISPIRSDNWSAQEKRLIAKGILSPPKNPRKFKAKPVRPAKPITAEMMKTIWDEEREDR